MGGPEERFLSHGGFTSQTDRPQCETAETPDARRACSSKLNSVSSGSPAVVRAPRVRCTLVPPCPVYTEIFIGRANRKWADRFDSSLVPKVLFRIAREAREGCSAGARYKSEKERRAVGAGRGREGGKRERRKSNAETQSCASISRPHRIIVG